MSGIVRAVRKRFDTKNRTETRRKLARKFRYFSERIEQVEKYYLKKSNLNWDSFSFQTCNR